MRAKVCTWRTLCLGIRSRACAESRVRQSEGTVELYQVMDNDIRNRPWGRKVYRIDAEKRFDEIAMFVKSLSHIEGNRNKKRWSLQAVLY